MNRDQANAYCRNLTEGGHDDWYLPSSEALQSLIVCSNGTQVTGYDDGENAYTEHPFYCGDGNEASFASPTIDSAFTCFNYPYFTSEYFSYDDLSYLIDFYDGMVQFGHGGLGGLYVRCVRGGQ